VRFGVEVITRLKDAKCFEIGEQGDGSRTVAEHGASTMNETSGPAFERVAE